MAELLLLFGGRGRTDSSGTSQRRCRSRFPSLQATRNSACDARPSLSVSAVWKLPLVKAPAACDLVTLGAFATLMRAQITSNCASLSFVGGVPTDHWVVVWECRTSNHQP